MTVATGIANDTILRDFVTIDVTGALLYFGWATAGQGSGEQDDKDKPEPDIHDQCTIR